MFLYFAFICFVFPSSVIYRSSIQFLFLLVNNKSSFFGYFVKADPMGDQTAVKPTQNLALSHLFYIPRLLVFLCLNGLSE